MSHATPWRLAPTAAAGRRLPATVFVSTMPNNWVVSEPRYRRRPNGQATAGGLELETPRCTALTLAAGGLAPSRA